MKALNTLIAVIFLIGSPLSSTAEVQLAKESKSTSLDENILKKEFHKEYKTLYGKILKDAVIKALNDLSSDIGHIRFGALNNIAFSSIILDSLFHGKERKVFFNSTPEQRQLLMEEIIGKEDYQKLAKACINKINNARVDEFGHSPQHDISQTLIILGQVLHYTPAKKIINKQFKNFTAVDQKVALIALCYLGNEQARELLYRELQHERMRAIDKGVVSTEKENKVDSIKTNNLKDFREQITKINRRLEDYRHKLTHIMFKQHLNDALRSLYFTNKPRYQKILNLYEYTDKQRIMIEVIRGHQNSDNFTQLVEQVIVGKKWSLKTTDTNSTLYRFTSSIIRDYKDLFKGNKVIIAKLKKLLKQPNHAHTAAHTLIYLLNKQETEAVLKDHERHMKFYRKQFN